MNMTIDWSDAVNSRVLVATINALDVINNTATITINSGPQIVGTPIHYLCNHNLDSHAARRVFRVNDPVIALYTGNGDTPSADNTTVVGLYGEIRRCRSIAGILFSLSGESVLINSTAIDGEKVEKPSIDVAGQTVTCRALTGQIVSIESQTNFRYSGAAGNNIYFDGVLWDTCPYTVNGAAVWGVNVVAVTVFGVFSRPLDKQTGWVLILDITGHDIYSHPFFFSSDGTKAISCDSAGNIFSVELGENNSITETSTYQFTGSHPAFTALTVNADQVECTIVQCLYADMQDNGTPTFGYLNYARTARYTSTAYDQSGNPLPANDVPRYKTIFTHDESHNFDIYITKIDITETAHAAAYLEFGDTIIDLIEQSWLCEKSVFQLITTGNSPVTEPIKQTINITQPRAEAKLVNINIKNNYYACYYRNESQQSAEISNPAGPQYTWYDPDNVTYNESTGINKGTAYQPSVNSSQQGPYRSKKINGTMLSAYDVSPPVNYEVTLQDNNYYMDILGALPLSALHIIGFEYYGMPQYAKHPITNDELTTWAHDSTQPPYIKFNGFDGIPLIWQGGPLIPPQSITLIPSNVRLV